MGMFDDMNDKRKDMMDDPDTKSKIEQIARDRNISIEEAKAHFLKHRDS